MPEFTGVIEKVTTKEGSGKKGPWTRYGIHSQGLWLNTFNDTQGNLAQQHGGTGDVFKFVYEEGQYGNDLKELAGPITSGNASDTEKPSSGQKAGTSSNEPRGGWDGKEQRINRVAIWKSYLEGDIPKALMALKEWPARPTIETVTAYVYDGGAALVRMVEANVYQGFDSPDEDEIPFG